MAHSLLEKFTKENITLEQIVERFLEEYDITNRYQKKDLADMLINADLKK